jgi:hypothetical protein
LSLTIIGRKEQIRNKNARSKRKRCILEVVVVVVVVVAAAVGGERKVE